MRKNNAPPGTLHYLQSGLKACYDLQGLEMPCTQSGQDAEFRPGAGGVRPRFEVEGQCVRDVLTGLTWTRSANPAQFPLTWNEAKDFVEQCNTQALAGYTDWRMPNRRELRSLIDYARRDPALSSGHPFTDVAPQWYWSATPWAGNPAYAWYVHFTGGRMFYGNCTDYYLLWPVRGTSALLPEPQAGAAVSGVSWTAERFEEQGAYVRDTLTRLCWTRDADLCGTVTWTRALEFARELHEAAYAGLRTWRLPTVNELESLVDASRHGPALPRPHPFRNVRQVYHSSTTSGYEPDWLMALYMDKGAVGVGYKPDAAFSVWCVAMES